MCLCDNILHGFLLHGFGRFVGRIYGFNGFFPVLGRFRAFCGLLGRFCGRFRILGRFIILDHNLPYAVPVLVQSVQQIVLGRQFARLCRGVDGLLCRIRVLGRRCVH